MNHQHLTDFIPDHSASTFCSPRSLPWFLALALLAGLTTVTRGQETAVEEAVESTLEETVITGTAAARPRPTDRPLEVTSSVIAPVASPAVASLPTVVSTLEVLPVEDSSSFNQFTADDVDLLRIRYPEDILRYAPNQFATNSGTRSFGEVYSVRGLTNTVFFGAPSTVIYVDDVPFGETFTYAQDLSFIENIDVLRGPQPTMVGRNAYGGLINIQTRRPTEEVEGGISTSYGSYDFQEYKGWVSGPIVDDTLGFRFGTQYDSRDGYLTNTTTGQREDNQEHKGFQGGLYWTPGTNWEASVTAAYDKYTDDGTRLTRLDRTTGFYTVGSDVPGRQVRDTNSQALRFAYDDGDFTFTSITSHRGFDLDPFTTDLDYTAFPGNFSTLSQTQELWSQEFRFAGSLPDPSWKWNAGLYGSTSRIHGDGTRDFVVVFPGPFFLPVQEITRHTIDELSLAGYAGLSHEINETVTLHGGGRIDWIERSLLRSKTSTIAAPASADQSNEWAHFTPTIGVDLKLSDTQLFYAKTSYAFKPGGYSAYVDAPAFIEYDEETSLATEVGLKSSWLDSRLVTNLAGFHNDIDNYQVERGINPLSTDYAVFNAARAKTYGLEFALQYEIMPTLDFLGSFGWTHARLTDYTDPVSLANLNGMTPPFVPDFDAAIGLEYHLDNGFFARGEYQAVGDTQFDDFNRQAFAQDDYGILNSVVGFRKEQWSASLYGTNLGETEYYTNINPAVNAGAVGAPLEVGVKLGLQF
ncbi:MAG: TonB-dependent receptor [Verrucomicrobiales bacterium]